MRITRVQISLLIFGLMASLVSCVSTYNYSGQRPRELSFAKVGEEVPLPDVLMGTDTVLIKPYIVLKKVVGTDLVSRSEEKTLARLQLQGQEVGADAIIKVEARTYQEADYSMLDALADDNYGDSREIRTFRELKGVAIKYIENVKNAQVNAPKLQEFFTYSPDGKDSTKVAAYKYDMAGIPTQVSDQFDEAYSFSAYIEPYTDYHLMEDDNRWETKLNYNGSILRRRRVDLKRKLEKVCYFSYKYDTRKPPFVLRYIKIEYYKESSQKVVSHREVIRITANKEGKIEKRTLTKNGVNIIEHWIYNADGVLSQINYFNDTSDKPFAVSYRTYYSDADWGQFIEKNAIYPQNEEAKG